MQYLTASKFIDVADSLYNIAKNQPNAEAVDVFARSAINRYYYAMFLIARSMLMEMAQWTDGTPHKSVPEQLRKLRRTRSDAGRKNPNRITLAGVTHAEFRSFLEGLKWLASTLDEGYRLRCLSDYHPECKIQQKSDTLTLDGVPITEMQGWKRMAEMHCNIVAKVFNAIR